MDDEAGAQAATEASLELEHRLLKAHIAEMYVLFDNDRRILEVNRNACEFFQRSEDQLVGKRLSEVFPQLNWAPLFQRLKRTLDTGETDHFETESIVMLSPSTPTRGERRPLCSTSRRSDNSPTNSRT
jgi:PAS domain S-box-containing protein